MLFSSRASESLSHSVGRTVCPSISRSVRHAVQIHTKKWSNLCYRLCSTTGDWCCRVYSLVCCQICNIQNLCDNWRLGSKVKSISQGAFKICRWVLLCNSFTHVYNPQGIILIRTINILQMSGYAQNRSWRYCPLVGLCTDKEPIPLRIIKNRWVNYHLLTFTALYNLYY